MDESKFLQLMTELQTIENQMTALDLRVEKIKEIAEDTTDEKEPEDSPATKKDIEELNKRIDALMNLITDLVKQIIQSRFSFNGFHY